MQHWLKTPWLFTKFAACVLAAVSLVGCASTSGAHPKQLTQQQVQTLDGLEASVLILGEQHDAPDHQRLHALVIEHLLTQQRLAAVVIEMATSDGQTTLLDSGATEQSVQLALGWDNNAWPWAAYAPAIMQAVAANVPVIGGNLNRVELGSYMQDTSMQRAVTPTVWAHHLQAVDDGHCNMLPATQLAPMARVQVARDQRMAQTVERATVAGKVVVLLTGSAHADNTVGVAQHLTASNVSIRFAAGMPNITDTDYNWTWPTPALEPTDYCARFKIQMQRRAAN
jgi:uncharacterized iron-regulated protein